MDAEALQSRLFEGMVFHVNGHTDVPIEELRRQIVLHGGRIEQYASSRSAPPRGPHSKSKFQHTPTDHAIVIRSVHFHRVTHILCKNLPHAKIRELTNQKLARGAHQQVPIIQPRFVQECLVAGKRLPHASYLVEGLKERHGQSLHGFLQPQQQPPPPQQEQQQQQADGHGNGPAAARTGFAAGASGGGGGSSTTSSAVVSPQQQQHRQSPAVSSSPSPRSSSTRSSGGGARTPWRDGRPPMSTKEDPHFLSRYYETSRLHWIGSFKAKLMQELGDEAAAKFKAAGGATRPAGGLVLHVDLDCFFVSALVRDLPELQGKPLAVAHADGAGTGVGQSSSSEISSCNYPARARGVRAAMFLGEARRLCPELTVLRYDFGMYEAVARQVYRIFFEEAAVVQPVSCDEAFLELAPGTLRDGDGDGEAAAARIRARILAETGCPASAGLSTNMLLARLATKQAKPNGQRALWPAEAAIFLESLPVTELPGVGWHLGQELEGRGVTTCGALQRRALAELQEWFGDKTGRMLWERCRGEDPRRVAPELGGPKSLGAEVNWGVRFDEQGQVERFLQELAEEVERRLALARVKGRQVVLKVKRSLYGPNEPEKLLGCGRCDNFSRSVTLARATASAKDIAAAALQLLRPLRVAPNLLRGLGIQIGKLEPQQPESPGVGEGGIAAWLAKQQHKEQQQQQKEEGGGKTRGLSPEMVDLDHDDDDDDEEGQGKKGDAVAVEVAAEDVEQEQGDGTDNAAGFGSGWEPVTPTPSPAKKKKQRRRAHLSLGAAGEEDGGEQDGEVEVLEVLCSPSSSTSASRKRARARTPAAAAGAAGTAAAAALPETATAEHWLLSLSQLDEDVLAGLPPDVQREVLEAARPSSSSAAAPLALPPAAPPPAPFPHQLQQQQRLPGASSGRGRGGGGRQLRVDAYDTRALQAEGADAEHLAALPPLVRVELNEQFIRGGRKLPIPAPGGWPPPPQYQYQQGGSASASSSPAMARTDSASHAAPGAGSGRKGGSKRPLQRQGSLQQQGKEEAEVVVMDGSGAEAAEPAAAAAAAAAASSQRNGRGRRRPRLFAVEGVDEVRRALGQWLRSIQDPQPPHFKLLSVYLLELLADGRADDAWALMRVFRRWAAERGAPAWRAGYRTVLGALEGWLRQKEGGRGGAGLCWAGLQLQAAES